MPLDNQKLLHCSSCVGVGLCEAVCGVTAGRSRRVLYNCCRWLGWHAVDPGCLHTIFPHALQDWSWNKPAHTYIELYYAAME